MNLPRRRLTRKLVALFVLPTVACVIVYGLVTFRLWEDALFLNASRELADHAQSLRATLSPLRASSAGGDLAQVMDRISEKETVHAIALYDKDGGLVARSRLAPAAAARVDRIAREVLSGPAVFESMERLDQDDTMIRAERLEGAGDLGALVVMHDVDRIEAEARRALLRILAAGAAIALVVGLVSAWLSRQLGRGLGDLVHAAEGVARGELDVPVVEGTKLLELDRVAKAFQEMTAALRAARANLERAEAERRELARRIQHAQSLSIAGQVAGSLAHEIGSPLNTILGWSRLAASDERVPGDVREQLDTIATQSERISRIVGRMLSFVRKPGDERHLVRVQDAVREVASFLGPDLRKRRVELTLDVDDAAPPVSAPPDALLQVLLNLCVNAMQAQPAGGAVRIRVGLEEGARAVGIEVADAGPGIPPSERAAVLEPFYSTKRAEGGTGLGLPIALDIVRELGGRLSVGEAPEGGALFRVTLPLE